MQSVPTQLASKVNEPVSAEDCFLILLRGIQNHSVIADADDAQQFRAQLAALERQFQGKEDARHLACAAVELLEKYASQANQAIARQKSGLGGAALELAGAIKALPAGSKNSDRWHRMEQLIDNMSPEDDLEEIRELLHADVVAARDEVLQERKQIDGLFHEILGKAELSSGISLSEAPQIEGSSYTTPDPLTGLPARAYAEVELKRLHSQSAPSFLALFVLKRLALINAKFGYSRGDQVLLKVIAQLAQFLPDFNNLFRWAPCAFLTMAPPNMTYKELRGKIQVIELSRMAPTLEWEGRSAMVPVVIDCRVVSVKDFATPSELFLRLDTLSADG